MLKKIKMQMASNAILKLIYWYSFNFSEVARRVFLLIGRLFVVALCTTNTGPHIDSRCQSLTLSQLSGVHLTVARSIIGCAARHSNASRYKAAQQIMFLAINIMFLFEKRYLMRGQRCGPVMHRQSQNPCSQTFFKLNSDQESN